MVVCVWQCPWNVDSGALKSTSGQGRSAEQPPKHSAPAHRCMLNGEGNPSELAAEGARSVGRCAGAELRIGCSGGPPTADHMRGLVGPGLTDASHLLQAITGGRGIAGDAVGLYQDTGGVKSILDKGGWDP